MLVGMIATLVWVGDLLAAENDQHRCTTPLWCSWRIQHSPDWKRVWSTMKICQMVERDHLNIAGAIYWQRHTFPQAGRKNVATRRVILYNWWSGYLRSKSWPHQTIIYMHTILEQVSTPTPALQCLHIHQWRRENVELWYHRACVSGNDCIPIPYSVFQDPYGSFVFAQQILEPSADYPVLYNPFIQPIHVGNT